LILAVVWDVVLLTLIILPIPASLYFFGLSGISVAVISSWTFFASQLIYSVIWARRFQKYADQKLRNWENLDAQSRIYDDDLIEDHSKRFYKRVIGVYPVMRDGSETEMVGASVPSQFRPVFDGVEFEEIGTGETQFLTGLQYIHLFVLEFYRRQNPGWDFSAENAPTMDKENADEPGVDQEELQKLDQYIRRAGEWFRMELDKPIGDSHIFARSEMYFSHKAEELREILSRPLLDPENPNNILSEEDIRDFEGKLRELGIYHPNNISQDDFNDRINEYTEQYNIKSNHPYWNEAARFAPRMLIFLFAFPFIYARGSFSPFDLIANFSGTLSPVFLIFAASLFIIGISSLLLSYWFYYEGNFLKDFQEFSPLKKYILSGNGRFLLIAGLGAGIIASLIFTPGLLVGVRVNSMDLVSFVLPTVFAAFLSMEIFSLWTNKISFLGTIRHYHFRPTAFVGHTRTILFMAFQYFA